MKLVFDIETDGIDATKVWCIVAQDVETKKIYKWRPDDIKSGLQFLLKADALIGHNIIGYDLAMLTKLYDLDFYNKKLYDTWLMSQVLGYKRKHKHGLGGWGEHLGYNKLEFSNFSEFT